MPYLFAFVHLCEERGHMGLDGMAWHDDGVVCMNDTTRNSECLGMFEHRGRGGRRAGVQALRRGRVYDGTAGGCFWCWCWCGSGT